MPEALAPAGLNPELLIKCLRTSGGSYDLLTKDIDRLRGAGLADSVLDFLLTTRSRRPPFSTRHSTTPRGCITTCITTSTTSAVCTTATPISTATVTIEHPSPFFAAVNPRNKPNQTP